METKNEKVENKIGEAESINHYVKLFIHWDESYWQAANVFLVVQAALIAALTQIKSLTEDNTWLLLVGIFGIFGLFISILNILVLNRKMSYTDGCEEMLRKRYQDLFYNEIKKRQIGLKKFSSATIMHTIFPSLFCIFWGLIIIVALYFYFILN